MGVTTTWSKQTIEPSSSWTEEINDIHHSDTGTVWGPQTITPSSAWTETLTTPTSTWSEQVIAPSTSWEEVLEQFKFWADGNSFWEEINTNYEDL